MGIAAAAVVSAKAAKPDITLRISRVKWELAPGHTVTTLAYNDSIPGPLLRMREGKPVAIEVMNETHDPEMVHWHGFHVPPEVDGAHEEGTPMVQGRDTRIYRFTPKPAGFRWYHTHAMAGHDLRRGGYTGQFGIAIIEGTADPGRYDAEVPIVLHEWDPAFSSGAMGDVDYRLFSINGRMLGAAEPVRVRKGQRVLMRFLNASASLTHRLALPRHQFHVVAMDGNPVPIPRTVPLLELAPGERIDAVVAMNQPGVWVLGEEDSRQRSAGAGIVVEYAGEKGKPQWLAPPLHRWDYLAFAATAAPSKPELITPLVVEARSDGNLWAINGKSYPHTDLIPARRGVRNRLIFDNRTDMAHPFHLHRHTLEITKYCGRPASGLFKDVVSVPAHQTAEVDFLAGSPGPSLFHCHHQFHMDFGFMALMEY